MEQYVMEEENVSMKTSALVIMDTEEPIVNWHHTKIVKNLMDISLVIYFVFFNLKFKRMECKNFFNSI